MNNISAEVAKDSFREYKSFYPFCCFLIRRYCMNWPSVRWSTKRNLRVPLRCYIRSSATYQWNRSILDVDWIRRNKRVVCEVKFYSRDSREKGFEELSGNLSRRRKSDKKGSIFCDYCTEVTYALVNRFQYNFNWKVSEWIFWNGRANCF